MFRRKLFSHTEQTNSASLHVRKLFYKTWIAAYIISPGLGWQRSCWSRCCCCWRAYRYDRRCPADDCWPGEPVVPVMRQAAAAAAACWYLDNRASCIDTGSRPNPGGRICPTPGPGRVGTLGWSAEGRHGRTAAAPGATEPAYNTTPHGRTEPGTLPTVEPKGEAIETNQILEIQRDLSSFCYSYSSVHSTCWLYVKIRPSGSSASDTFALIAANHLCFVNICTSARTCRTDDVIVQFSPLCGSAADEYSTRAERRCGWVTTRKTRLLHWFLLLQQQPFIAIESDFCRAMLCKWIYGE